MQEVTNRAEIRDGDKFVLAVDLDKDIPSPSPYFPGLSEDQRKEILETASFAALGAFPDDFFEDARLYLITRTETQVTGA